VTASSPNSIVGHSTSEDSGGSRNVTSGDDSRRLLSVSLDLDNLWSYMKVHGDSGWQSFPSYFDPLVEIVLDRLKKHGLTITVFVVGQDAALEKNSRPLRALGDAGHEIANHSFHHQPWFHLYSHDEIEEEISMAESAIEKATGKRPKGFRGPGFSLSPATLRVLAQRGYAYDATTFPTFLGPLARMYYFWTNRDLSKEERAQRKRLFGRWKEGFRPIRPYTWEVDGHRLVEIPVTTMPIFRIPIHMSYLMYLASYSPALSRAYLWTTLKLCCSFGVEPSFLLHPLDFLGGDKVRELSFFPGMNLDTEFKLNLLDHVIESLKRHFSLVTMESHAQAVLGRETVPRKKLSAEAVF